MRKKAHLKDYSDEFIAYIMKKTRKRHPDTVSIDRIVPRAHCIANTEHGAVFAASGVDAGELEESCVFITADECYPIIGGWYSLVRRTNDAGYEFWSVIIRIDSLSLRRV